MNKNKNNNMAVGYCRVSTEDQADNGISLEYQEEQCRKASINDGYKEILIIKDEGKSGTSISKRKGIQQVIELAKNKEISIVYVTNSDRLARNILDHSFLRNIFKSNNVILKYLNGQSSDNDANSIMADNMFATVNQYHSDITKEKTKQALDTKALAGYFPTSAPVGYLNTENSDKNCNKVAKKIIIPNPKNFHFVKEAFKMFATGQYNVYELNDLLNEKGFVSNSGRKLAPSMFYAMLKNRIYLGEVHWIDIHVKNGKHEPLIDENTFERVQAILNKNNNNRCRRRKYFWLLSGYVFCPIHNCRYTAEWHLNKGKAYYHCSNKNGCGKYVEKQNLEKQVSDKLKSIEFSDEFIKIIVEKTRNFIEENSNKYQQEKRGLENQKIAWEAKLRTIETKLLDEVIKDSDYKRLSCDIHKEIERINRNILLLEKNTNTSGNMAIEIMNFCKNIHKTYMETSEELQKKFLALCFDRFEVKDGVIIKERYSMFFQQLLELNMAFQKNTKSKKTFENQIYEMGIINPKMGGYRESNPNQRNHNPLC